MHLVQNAWLHASVTGAVGSHKQIAHTSSSSVVEAEASGGVLVGGSAEGVAASISMGGVVR